MRSETTYFPQFSVKSASHYEDAMAAQVFKIHLPQEIRWDAVIPEE